MSRVPITKYDSVIIANEQHCVPQGWGHLFSSTLPVTHEQLDSIQRTRYQTACGNPPLNGEVWTCESGLSKATASHPYKVSAGYLNMLVLSGALTVTKNGRCMYVRAGEKVSFQPGDIFCLEGAPQSKIVVRNQAAQLTPSCHPPVTHTSAPVSQSIVNMVRSQLGLSPGGSERPLPYRDDSRTSSAYRGQPKYGRSGAY